MKSFLAVGLAICLFACNAGKSTEAEVTETTVEEQTIAAPERAGEVFGAEEDFSEAIDLAALETNLVGQDTLEQVIVQGEVTGVCQAKGCWMTIAGKEDMMVRFKDYGFFMPKDIDGREVVMHGRAYYQTTSVDELRHYAEDAGKSAEEIAMITEPKKELRFLASGVLLLPEE
ncbi:MAG: DUF4920 domain-containing protein [Bacteroidota bacterium]